MFRSKVSKLAVGLVACASLASCNWYDIPKGQHCCSSGVPTNPQVVRPGTEAQPTTTVPNLSDSLTPEQQCAKQVANVLGIHWSVGDGATERLNDFERFVAACLSNNPNSNDGYGYICNLEPSQTVEGYEIIAHPVGMTPTIQGVRIPCP